MTGRQAEGVAALAALAALMTVWAILGPSISFEPAAVPCLSNEQETLAVALTWEGKEKGVYFLPQGAKLADLFAAAGLAPQDHAGKGGDPTVLTGDHVHASGGSGYSLGRMKAAQALALDLPLEINSLSCADLVLVPGIGEKTAAQIIALREKKGAYGALEELMEIKGIKEKKLAKLRRYFFIAKHP